MIAGDLENGTPVRKRPQRLRWRMNALFPIEVDPADIPEIPGLSYVQEYVSRAEEIELVDAIDREPWDTSWQRRRQPYGASYGNKKTRASDSGLGSPPRCAVTG